jgi:hypothetical protein
MHSVSANWEGLEVCPDSYLYIGLQGQVAQGEPNDVPDGGATLTLFPLALAAMAYFRKWCGRRGTA